MMPSVLATSAVGEALVLHQHGIRGVHLHLLGNGDLRSNAARSAAFGHRSQAVPTLQSESRGARILAVIPTGSLFVSGSQGEEVVKAGLPVPLDSPVVLPVGSSTLSAVRSLQNVIVVPRGRTASAVILNRNHTLLL